MPSRRGLPVVVFIRRHGEECGWITGGECDTKGRAAARTRLGLAPTDGLDRDQPCELLAVIGDELDSKLLGPKGAEDALVVPARAVRILGLRQGAVFAVSP